MTMYRDPIVWNGNQQLLGEEIRTYMKDSTIDRAHVIGQALSVEQMFDTVHFNQLTSKEMLAFFTKGEIREAHAKDNAIAICRQHLSGAGLYGVAADEDVLREPQDEEHLGGETGRYDVSDDANTG